MESDQRVYGQKENLNLRNNYTGNTGKQVKQPKKYPNLKLVP